MSILNTIKNVGEGFAKNVLKPVSDVLFSNTAKTVGKLVLGAKEGVQELATGQGIPAEKRQGYDILARGNDTAVKPADILWTGVELMPPGTASALKFKPKSVGGLLKQIEQGAPHSTNNITKLIDKKTLFFQRSIRPAEKLADVEKKVLMKPPVKPVSKAVNRVVGARETRRVEVPKALQKAKSQYRFLHPEDKNEMVKYIDQVRIDPKAFDKEGLPEFKKLLNLEVGMRRLAEKFGINENASRSKLADAFELIIKGTK